MKGKEKKKEAKKEKSDNKVKVLTDYQRDKLSKSGIEPGVMHKT